MNGYKLINSPMQDSITLKDGKILLPVIFNEKEQESVIKAVDFWNIKRIGIWICEANNDNGIDDSKETIDIFNLNPENVIVLNEQAIGYYFKKLNQCLLFGSYNSQKNFLKSNICESSVGGWGDITEYDLYKFILRNGKENEVDMWNSNNNKKVTINDDVITEFSQYGNVSVVEEVEICEGCTFICEKAFSNCVNLKKITIPSTMEIIESQAFLNCTSLKEVIIKNGLRSIYADAFENCSSLEEIVLPNSVIMVEKHRLFSGCSNLTKVSFPKNIEYIDHFTCIGNGNIGIDCYTIDETGKNPNRVRTLNGSLLRYTATTEETKLIAKEVKNWKLNLKQTTIHYDYGTENQTYSNEKDEDKKLEPNFMIINKGKVVGYYYNQHVGYNRCFYFDKFDKENPEIYEYKKTHTIGAYYYRPPHTQVVETFVCKLLKIN